MDINDLVLYSESLYKTAYHKMNNTTDADELTQETLLQALIELRKNPDKVILNEQAWLNGILNNCFYTMMRKKYKTAYVTYDVIMDNYLSEDNISEFIENEETAELYGKIKRSVSALAKIHRDVIHLFYINNKSVNEIAEKLNIPRGTVLSRLDNGRKLIKKGVTEMNKNNTIYVPQKLGMGITGRDGDNHEPFSCVATSIHQNILINAYEKPVTENEIAEIMGIPCVYIEEIVEKLISAELMKRTSGGKVYTDFIIAFENDRLNKNKDFLNIVNDKFDDVWNEYKKIFDNLLNLDFVNEMPDKIKNKLYVFAIMKAMETVMQKIRKDYQENPLKPFSEYPHRPNNGKWIATGTQSTNDDILKPYKKYAISGMLSSDFDYKDVHINGMDYQTSFGDTHHGYPISGYFDKFLYDIKINDISHENQKYLKDIPRLCEMGILDNTTDITKLDIPQITFDQLYKLFPTIDNNNLYDILKDSVIECYKKQNTKLPAHLKDSIPEEFIINNTDVLRTGFLVTAKEKGLFLKDVDYPCPAMVFIC